MRITVSLFSVTIAGLMALPEPAAPPAASAEPDRMQQTVCRKDKVIGSLIATKKTCHTRSQWAYIDEKNQSFSRDMVDSTRTKSGGN